MARRVLVKSIVCRSTRQRRLLKCTSEIVPLHPKTLKKYSVRRDNLDVEGQMETFKDKSQFKVIIMRSEHVDFAAASNLLLLEIAKMGHA